MSNFDKFIEAVKNNITESLNVDYFNSKFSDEYIKNRLKVEHEYLQYLKEITPDNREKIYNEWLKKND